MTLPIRPSQRDHKVYRRCRFSGTLPALYTAGRSVRVGEVPETAAGHRRGPLLARVAGLCEGRAARTPVTSCPGRSP